MSDQPTTFKIGSVTYHNAPAYELPEGGGIGRPGLDPKNKAHTPTFDDKDPVALEVARINGRLVRPDSGLFEGAQIIGDSHQPKTTEPQG